MTYPTIFANESGNQPASQLDTMYNVCGQQGVLPCTASGTNVITLTSQTNIYASGTYTDKQCFSWTAAATSTGPVTMSSNGGSVLNHYDATGVQSNSGSIQLNTDYVSMYSSHLNTGAGGFIIINNTGAAAVNTPVPLMGSFKNLLVTNTTAATAASQIAVSFDEAILENSTGGTVKVGLGFSGAGGLSFTINANSTGAANGLDTGSFAINNYFVWVIYNPTSQVTAGLLSLSATTPVLPSGYTYKARAGACFAVAGPKFVNWMQKGNRAQYLVGTYNSNALAALPIMTSGVSGSITTPTWTAVAVAGFAPTTAQSIKVSLTGTTTYGNGVTSGAMSAPNNNYGAINSTSNPAPLSDGMVQSTGVNLVHYSGINQEWVLESSNIYYASNQSATLLQCLGWVDSVNA